MLAAFRSDALRKALALSSLISTPQRDYDFSNVREIV
jgi:hypothetical protein